jgi:hypothetical protein
MEEFRGMDDDPIVNQHSLYGWMDRYVPRPVMIHTGFADQRVGQDRLEALIHPMASAYEQTGAAARFKHVLMDLPGHDGTRIPDSALDIVVTWLRERGLL